MEKEAADFGVWGLGFDLLYEPEAVVECAP